jgi:hypothetical protein
LKLLYTGGSMVLIICVFGKKFTKMQCYKAPSAMSRIILMGRNALRRMIQPLCVQYTVYTAIAITFEFTELYETVQNISVVHIHRKRSIYRRLSYILADVLAMDILHVGAAPRLFCGFFLK